MKKQRPTVFYVITLFFIWGTITMGLCFNLLFVTSFFIKLVLAILSFAFLALFLFYLRKLFFVYNHESEKLKKLNTELEKALNRIEEAQAENHKKEILLNVFLEKRHENTK